MVANMQLSSKKISSYSSGTADPIKIIDNEASTCQYHKYILGSCWSELTELFPSDCCFCLYQDLWYK